MPVLVYLFSIPATQATGYSLFIVGATSLVGALFAAKRGHVDVRTGAVFALPALVSVYLVRRLAVPAIPDTLFSVGSTEVTRDTAILALFGTLMLFAAVAMIRPRKTDSDKENGHAWKLAVKGLLVGTVTGLVGAGGGFLIVPALLFFAKLPMKSAVGTSLSIIALNSLVGFVGEAQATSNIDWALLGAVTGIAVAGILVGGAVGKMISGAKLKPAFGWFILAMGVFLVGSTVVAGCNVVETPSSSGVENTAATTQSARSEDITAVELNELMAQGGAVFLLDVRTLEEREISVLDDDAHIPIDELEARLEELDKDADIVVYCRTGSRSGRATNLLRENGFTSVRNLLGGINGWSEDVDSAIEKYGD